MPVLTPGHGETPTAVADAIVPTETSEALFTMAGDATDFTETRDDSDDSDNSDDTMTPVSDSSPSSADYWRAHTTGKTPRTRG